MTGTIASIRARLDDGCIVGRCRKDGCSVSLDGAPAPRLIVDVDELGAPPDQKDKKCDYLFFAEPSGHEFWFAPIELKKGKADASVAIKQIQKGADAAQRLMQACVAARAQFRPVLACRGMHKKEREELKSKSNRIKFHGRREHVRWIKCCAPLMSALKR